MSTAKQSSDSSSHAKLRVEVQDSFDDSSRLKGASLEGPSHEAKTPEAKRNLVLGIVLNLIAIPMCGAAFVCAPREAFVSLAAALLIALVVFVSMQFGVMMQRNGTFALMGLGLVLTLLVPLGVSFCSSGAEWVRLLMDARRAKDIQVAAGRDPAPPGTASRSELASTARGPFLSDAGSAAAQPANAASTAAPLPTALPVTESKVEATADSKDFKGVGIKADKGAKASEAQIEDSMRPEESSAERITRLSKDEALKRYPGLATPGTPEHSRYLDAYNEFARLRKFEFFKDPKWPLNLAELVALKEGWRRADQAQSERPSDAAPEPQRSAGLPSAQAGASGAKAAALPPSPVISQASDRGSSQALPGDGLSLEIPAVDGADPNAKAVNQAMIEVRRRYPAVGQDGTPENRAYLSAYRELERLRPDFFENPQWPLKLADLVAKSEGWKR